MSRGKRKPDTPDNGQPEPGAPERGSGAAAEPAPVQPPAPAPAAAPQGEGGPSLEEQIAGLKDRLLRKAAEFDNYQKRIAKEIEEIRKYAAKPLAQDLLAAFDNLERALAAATAEGSAEGSAGSLLQGVRMVHEQIEAALAGHGIVPVDALGRLFDPNLHDAVGEQEDPDLPDRTVIDVLTRGYMLHDRLLRPARVRVSRRPRPSAPESPEPGTPPDSRDAGAKRNGPGDAPTEEQTTE